MGEISDDSVLVRLSADFDDSATWGTGWRQLGAIVVGVVWVDRILCESFLPAGVGVD